MLAIGTLVRITGLPFYGIGAEHANTNFFIIDIRRSEACYLLSDGYNRLYFPISEEEMLIVNGANKWNKLGYVSPFKPLKLP